MIDRLVFWVGGTALFLAVALLPNLLLAWFYTGGQAHATAVPVALLLFLVLWGSARLFAPRR